MSAPKRFDATLRSARREDVDVLVELCAEHAEYERSEYSRAGKNELLAEYLFGARPRVHVLVAETPGGLVGYASWSSEVSTWRAKDHACLDCLYLRPDARGQGLGEDLVRAVARESRALGFDWMEWQTPAWNERAIEFYTRLGAGHTTKARFGVETRTLR